MSENQSETKSQLSQPSSLNSFNLHEKRKRLTQEIKKQEFPKRLRIKGFILFFFLGTI